jgi:uncharacterized membrane protein YpjA
MIRRAGAELLGAAGVGLVLYGLWTVMPPLAWIAAGAMLVLAGVALLRARP